MLTTKQEKFIEAYKSTGDLKQAVIQAGYSPKTRNSIAVEAKRLLKNPKISLQLEFEYLFRRKLLKYWLHQTDFIKFEKFQISLVSAITADHANCSLFDRLHDTTY